MRASVVFTADGRLNTKSNRVQSVRRKSDPEDGVATSYKSNSTKEELCFEYISAFTEQFHSLYPKRRIPYMIAENEYGVRKFVCSTIRPTQLPISELYDMYECASFLSGFIIYEPLDPPDQPPKVLVSPTMTLKTHTGDCFDMAMLLCSFLIANGYDAYVIYGYAPKFIALRDQSQTICPLSSTLADVVTMQSDEPEPPQEESASSSTSVSGENAYVPPDNGVKNSKYVAEREEQARKALLDPFVLWEESSGMGNPITEAVSAAENSGAPARDKNSRCVHAWVLVRAGRRDVKEHVFLEPSTGRAYSVLNSPYLGVENAWNNNNFWIFLNNKDATETAKVSEIDFDLSNGSAWEYLFSGPGTAQPLSPDASSAAVPAMVSTGGDATKRSLLGAVDSAASGADPMLSLRHLAVNTMTGVEKHLDPPPTWVVPLHIDRPMLLLRYPPAGKRTVYYLRAKADYFAKNTHNQGMVMRVTTFLDNQRTMVKEIHEWFENRKDKMYKRVRHMLNSHYFVEYFHPGSIGEVKQWLEYPGKRTDILFHVNGRLDRLKRRVDVLGEKSVEFFEHRIDKLVYRATYLTTDKSTTGGRQFTLPGHSLSNEIYILRMMQIYERNPESKNPGNDVAKRTFFVKEGKAVVQYHYAPGKITSMVKTFPHTRGGAVTTGTAVASTSHAPGTSAGPATADSAPGTAGNRAVSAVSNAVHHNNNANDDNPQDDDVVGLQEAAVLERECYAAVKASQAQMQSIAEFRQDMERNVTIERTVFEVAFEGVDKGGTQNKSVTAAEAAAESKGVDYLTPYLRHIPDIAKITKEEALEIRQVCLDALKARLVERANIIQSRLNKENNELAKRQDLFQRLQREGDNQSTDDYMKYCTAAMFRIQILEERLGKHEETALKKFADLDAKLASDPRLKVLRNA